MKDGLSSFTRGIQDAGRVPDAEVYAILSARTRMLRRGREIGALSSYDTSISATLGLPGVGFSLPDPLRADLWVMTGEADILLCEEQVG